MYLDEMPWKYHHHQSSFLPSYQMVEDHFETSILFDIETTPQSLVLIHTIESEGNLSNIRKTVSIIILVKPGVLENIHFRQNRYASELRSYATLFKGFRDIFS